MTRLYYSLLTLLLSATVVLSPAQDTTIVQTLDFDDITKRRGWYQFPEGEEQYRKILMHYTLKCDAATTQDGFPCGEWDYTSLSDLFRYQGVGTQYYHQGTEILDTIFYADGPVVDTYQQYSYFPVIDEVVSENEVSIGLSSESIPAMLPADRMNGRSQFIIGATDAEDAGLNAGLIYTLYLDALAGSDPIDRLVVRMAHTDEGLFAEEQFREESFTEVFDGGIHFEVLGLQPLPLYVPFDWDGTSDILIDLAYTNDPSPDVASIGGVMDAGRCLVTTQDERHLDFEFDQYVDIPAEVFSDIDQQITISFWSYIDSDDVPYSAYAFEGVDGEGRRVVNAHLPWSNGRIYWDAGHDMSSNYDRVDEEASPSDYTGGWHHFAFVKDAGIGEMALYIDGEEFMSGSGMTRSMSGIEKFRIAARAEPSFSGVYRGKMDEFQIWSTALDEDEIVEWMHRSVDGSHPQFSALEAAYDFNGEDGLVAVDYSPAGQDGMMMGVPARLLTDAEEIFMNATSSDVVPAIQLTQGEYLWHLDSTVVDVEIPRSPVTVVQSIPFIDQEQSGVQYTYLDTFLIDLPGTAVTYSPDGSILSETEVAVDGFFANEFSQDRHQIQNYVTPYGIGLDLGPDGFRWVYDVTDYAPVLRGLVEIAAGNQQELIDLKFEFIEGTPARDVLGFETLWLGNFAHAAIADDEAIPAMDVDLMADAEEFRVKTRTTGHWFGGVNNCAEFCPKQFHLDVDGSMEFQWYNWKECADNPVIDQGGTWIYDRAGWCPGTFADTYDLEITPFVGGGATHTLNFGMEQYPQGGGEGNYHTTGILIQYGAKSHQVDGEIRDIISPNNWEFHNRQNPVCKDPVVAFRNLGEDEITSAVFSYRTAGGVAETYEWTGSLEFNEEVEVTLPISALSFWGGNGDYVFEVELLSVNGAADEYADNDVMTAPYDFPDIYAEPFIVWLNTNNVPSENEWWIYDSNGDEVYNRDPTLANTNYRDTIILPAGCYHLRLNDTGQDGLSFFANNDGSGFFRLKAVGGPTIMTFNPNFGSFIDYHFVVGDDPTAISEQEIDRYITIHPNPSEGLFNLTIETYLGSDLHLEVLDAQGKLVASFEEPSAPDLMRHVIDLSDQPSGIYFVKMLIDDRQVVRRIMKQ